MTVTIRRRELLAALGSAAVSWPRGSSRNVQHEQRYGQNTAHYARHWHYQNLTSLSEKKILETVAECSRTPEAARHRLRRDA